ncbi:MAG: hypothetical protein J5708_01780 [Bacteroidales bacterium]|nr:hypothetical protein [Bacteroidales bacterium]
MTKMPSSAEMQAINDSIVAEGYQLYYSERANWIATDLLFEKCDMANVGGSVTYQPDDNTWVVVFFDRNDENCVLEYRVSTLSDEAYVFDSIRPISEEERILWIRNNTLINKAIRKYGDKMQFASKLFGSPNLDIIEINDHLIRMYFLQGTIKHDLIPFGNDYSIDCDENLEPIAFRKYHNSLIAIPTKDNGEEVRMTMHSHLPDNPFITPTDICNFLLYRSADMDSFSVLSIAYNCVFTFSLNRQQIFVEKRK